jgi:CO/xanthine dehydrogenase Mo-binding subunit
VSLAVELQMTRVADVLGISPWELRLRNANRIGDTTANRVAMQDPSTVPVTLAAAERVGEQLTPEYKTMTGDRRSGELLPDHLVAQQAPEGAHVLLGGGGRS